MDALILLTACGLGLLLGTCTGLVPGLHANTLIAVAALGPWSTYWAYVLICVAVVHTFVTILPNLYLGVPDEDTGLAVLPGHQMLLEGKSRLAVRISADSSLAALILVVLLALPMKWLLLEPIGLMGFADRWGAWLLIAIALWLIGREPNWQKQLWAVAIWCSAGALGVWAVAHSGPLGFSQSPLLALLTGMFGLAGLLWSLQTRHVLPYQDRSLVLPPLGPLRRSVLAGVAASSVTAVLPGVTAAVATSFSRAKEPERAIAAMSAINTAHATLVLFILFATLRTRSALAMHVAPLATFWDHVPPTHVFWMAAAMLVSGAAAWIVTLALDVPMARCIHAIPARGMSLAAAVTIVALVGLLGGWYSLALLAAATSVGWATLLCGIRRVHMIGVLVLPILLY